MRYVGGMSNNLNESHMIGSSKNVTQNGINATITVPPGSTINNATVTVFQPRFLSGTWNLVNNHGNVSGSITFSNQDLCPTCKQNSHRYATFSGIFSGNPVSGTYNWETAPPPPSFYKLPPTSSLLLMYRYHHKGVVVLDDLTVINPTHMEMTDINSWRNDHNSSIGSDYTVALSGFIFNIILFSLGERRGYLSTPRYFFASLSMCSSAPSLVCSTTLPLIVTM